MGYVERALAPTVIDAMGEARVVALLGPRQSGKTTLVRALSGPLAAAYLTLDDEPVRSLAQGDPAGFIAGLTAGTVIDEVQRAPDLLLAIKSRVDRDDTPGQFLLTGSANLRRIPSIADALPGRADYLTLFPFTQGELAGRPERFLETVLAGKAPSISGAPTGRGAYVDRIVTGGFPEATRRSPAARARFFNGYVESIVDRDVADAGRVRDAQSVGTLLRLVAARSGSLARYDGLGRDAGIDGKTAKSYLDVLERLFLVRVRRPWHTNLGKRQVKAPKLYIADPGLMASMVGADLLHVRDDDGLAGALFETFVAVELERQASWMPSPISFWHYRDGEREIDIMIEAPSGEVVGIEVKPGATVRPPDFSGLTQARERLGARFRCGIVLYSGEQTLPFADRLWAIPLAALWQT